MQKAYNTDRRTPSGKLPEPVFADQRQFERHSPRQIINALFYRLKTGGQWRLLLKGFAPWETVYHHFRKWRENGRIERLCIRLRRAARVKAGRRPSPSTAVIGSQSVKTARQGSLSRGRHGGGKNVAGRKRHVIADTTGLGRCERRLRADSEALGHRAYLRLVCQLTAIEPRLGVLA